MIPDREALAEVVQQWFDGVRTTRSVHEWAEPQQQAHLTSEEWSPARPAPDAIAWEVLLRLSFLNAELLTQEDGPAIIRFLRSRPSDESTRWEEWTQYREGVHTEERRAKLATDPYYYT
jgi:hypothetical protein